jgi:hypothetical protein
MNSTTHRRKTVIQSVKEETNSRDRVREEEKKLREREL